MTKQSIIRAVHKKGLAVLNFLLLTMVTVLYGRWDWKKFRFWYPGYSCPTQAEFIAGVDKALRDNLSPGEALDKTARKFGVPEDVIKASIGKYN